MQDVVCTRQYFYPSDMISDSGQVVGILFWGWLGGHQQEGGAVKSGQLLTIEEVGGILKSLWPNPDINDETGNKEGTWLTERSPRQSQRQGRVPSHDRGVPSSAHLGGRGIGTFIRTFAATLLALILYPLSASHC
jgi:hypothetical protein